MAEILSYTGMMALIWTLWSVAFALVVFRGSFQWVLQRRLHLDDYFSFAGLVFLTALSAVITRLLPQFYLSGEYIKAAAVDPLTPLPLPMEEFTSRTVTSLKLMFSQMLLFWTTLWAAKFSILFFIRRLLSGLPKYMRWWWVCFTVVLILYLACMLSNFLTCTPLHRYWSPAGCSAPEDLVRADASIRFATGADIAADGLTMILPLHLLRKIQTSRSHKFGLAVLFSLGGIIIAFALVRLVQVTQATRNSAADPTTAANGPVLLSMWSHIESTVSVIVAALPAFRFLLRKNRANMASKSNKYPSNPQQRSGISLGSRWTRGRTRLDEDPTESKMDSGTGSQTELHPMGRIQKDTEFSLAEFRSDSSRDLGADEDAKRKARDIFA